MYPNFDFNLINYVNTKTKVKIICKKHGILEVFPSCLLKGTLKCPQCDLEERQDQFISNSNKIHNNKYNYSKVNYKTNKIPVEIICPTHGSFMQAPGDHLKGYGCSKCSKKYKPTTKEWIEKASPIYNYKYNYSKVEYIDNKTPVIVICPIHGEFSTIPNNHTDGNSGCPKCAAENRHMLYKKSTTQFIQDAQKVHGNKYDYSKVEYYNKDTAVEIICKIHGSFMQRPSSHLNGCGCSKCRLKNQQKLYEELKKLFPYEIILWEYSPEWLGNQRFDIYFPQYNIAVEYDGEQHFTPIMSFGGELKFQKTLEMDKLKNEKCKINNCNLFRISYNTKPEEKEKIFNEIRELIFKNKT